MEDRLKTGKTAEVHLDRSVLEAMRDHVADAYPEEACGALLGRTTDDGVAAVIVAEPIPNSRRDGRARRYLIGPDDVLKLERRAEATGCQVVGYYHSHPDAPPVPSDFDRENALPWYVYMILSVRAGRAGDLRAWRLSDDRRRFEAIDIRGAP